MKTVVYLANLQMKIVVGSANKKSISVKQAYTFDTPEGSIINGMIMDVELFTSFLRDVWEENKFSKSDVSLVINSNKFVGRSIEMPVLNDNQTVDYISREYADMGKEEELSFSYIHIADAEGKRRKIYAEGISPEFIKEYIDIFESAGIKLVDIYSGESSIITFTNQTLAKDSKSFILLIADEMSFTKILWLDGAFYYYNAARCFHDPGTMEYASDIARSVSQLMQFMKAHQIETPLDNIYLAGLSREDESLYRGAILEMGIEVPVKVADYNFGSALNSEETQKYLHAVSGLCSGGKTQNFLVQYKEAGKKKKTAENANLISSLILLGSILAVMLVILITLGVTSSGKRKELEKLEEYNTNPMRQTDLMDYEYYLRRNGYLISQYNAINEIDNNIVTYPTGNSKVLDVLKSTAIGYADITYDSFDAESGVISMSAKAKNVEDINKFIKKLTEQKMFSNVDYTGYRYNEQQEMWDVHVTCTLAEAAGR